MRSIIMQLLRVRCSARSLPCALACARHELSLPRARYALDACLLRAICALAARLPRAGALRFRGAKRHVFRIEVCKSRTVLRFLMMLHMFDDICTFSNDLILTHIGESLQYHTVSLIEHFYMCAPCALVARSLRARCALAARSLRLRARCVHVARSLRTRRVFSTRWICSCSTFAALRVPFALATDLACRALVTRWMHACFALSARWLRACRALGLYAFAAQSDTCFELKYAKV